MSAVTQNLQGHVITTLNPEEEREYIKKFKPGQVVCYRGDKFTAYTSVDGKCEVVAGQMFTVCCNQFDEFKDKSNNLALRVHFKLVPDPTGWKVRNCACTCETKSPLNPHVEESNSLKYEIDNRSFWLNFKLLDSESSAKENIPKAKI